jgi:hypothetical protein
VKSDSHTARNSLRIVARVHSDNLALADDLASHPFPIVDHREFKPEVKSGCGLKDAVSPKQNSRAADVLSVSLKPLSAAGQAVTNGDVNWETPRSSGIFLPFSQHKLLFLLKDLSTEEPSTGTLAPA